MQATRVTIALRTMLYHYYLNSRIIIVRFCSCCCSCCYDYFIVIIFIIIHNNDYVPLHNTRCMLQSTALRPPPTPATLPLLNARAQIVVRNQREPCTRTETDKTGTDHGATADPRVVRRSWGWWSCPMQTKPRCWRARSCSGRCDATQKQHGTEGKRKAKEKWGSREAVEGKDGICHDFH